MRLKISLIGKSVALYMVGNTLILRQIEGKPSTYTLICLLFWRRKSKYKN